MRPIFAAVLFLGCALTGAAAQTPATNSGRVDALGLPRLEGAVTLSYSRAAEREAAVYHTELEAAVAWYRRETGWSVPVRVAVLSKADFPRATSIPYPTPHAETATGFIILADRVDEHPGFDLWDLDAVALNTAWGFHEMGHVLARDLGIASTSAWVGELIANMFMAAYVRAERPALAGFQSGLPPRFREPQRYTSLAEFDALYFGMGQQNYLWFQFEIARLADYLVARGNFPGVVAGLQREFPAARRARESVAETFARLERIRPGVTAAAGALATR